MNENIYNNCRFLVSERYLGNCKDIVNPTDTEEVSALALMVEGGEEITKHEFFNSYGYIGVSDESIQAIEANPDNYTYFVNAEEGIAWYYDYDDDVEYFYDISQDADE